MKFAISLEQKDYLKKNGFIPFSDLLTKDELITLNQGIDEALNARLQKNASNKDLFACGHDLFRDSPLVKRIVTSKKLVGLIYELVGKKPIRLAFDQLLPEHTPYSKAIDAFSETATFQEMSGISNLQGIFLISIKTFPGLSKETALLPASGYFILPSHPFPFLTKAPSDHHRFFLIGYGEAYSQYLYEPKDPQNHYLKSLGYVFGDKLNDREHPILFR